MLASLRLKVENREVTEAEWILARDGMAFYNPAGFAANPPPQTRDPGVAAETRDVLIAASNSYFTGIDESDGDLVMEHPSCYRIENGTLTVGRLPGMPAGPGDGVTAPLSGDADTHCTQGFDNLRNVTEAVINRRFFADTEAGVGWGNAVFKRVEGYRTSQGEELPRLYFTELFKVEDGEIRGIYAIMTYLPPEIPTSGWPDGPLSPPP